MTSIVRSQNIKVTDVTHDPLKKKPSGAKSVRMTLGGKNMVIQIDKARVPFGMSCFENEKGDAPKKYSLELSLGGSEKMDKFKDILEKLDDLNVTYCSQNSKDWWGKKVSENVMREAETYKSLIKPDKKGENPSRFKVKLPFYNNKPMFKVFDKTKKEINFYTPPTDQETEGHLDWSWAQPGMEIKLIAECEGLWVVSRNIYCTWRASQIAILSSGNKMNEYAFQDDEEEEDVQDEASDEESYDEASEEEEDDE
jgi:hypothetical protein